MISGTARDFIGRTKAVQDCPLPLNEMKDAFSVRRASLLWLNNLRDGQAIYARILHDISIPLWELAFAKKGDFVAVQSSTARSLDCAEGRTNG